MSSVANQSRHVRMVRPLDPEGRGAFSITTQEGMKEPETTLYACTVFPAFDGASIGVYLTKEEGEGTDADCQDYQVNLDSQQSTCSCRGFLRWGHRHPCRHIGALLSLQGKGKLDVPPAVEEQPVEAPAHNNYATAVYGYDLADVA
jgi:SWIM zinc finger